MAEIIVRFDDKVIERIVTEKKRISIGRTKDNDVVLENRGVSRKHALIEFNEKAAIVIDNESLNGTFVNNRKISEEVLRDDDVITIGKYQLIYHSEQSQEHDTSADFDGTMILNTKRQKKLLENDKVERELVNKYGGSVLLGEENADFSEFKLDREVTTIGKAKFVHLRVKGFWISPIQAKITHENNSHVITNLGKKGKTLVNGEPVTMCILKNGDLVTVGRTTFKYVEGTN